MRGRSISFASGWPGLRARKDVRHSGRVIGRGRWCSSIGARCPRLRGSRGSSRRCTTDRVPSSSAQMAHFSFDTILESFLERRCQGV